MPKVTQSEAVKVQSRHRQPGSTDNHYPNPALHDFSEQARPRASWRSQIARTSAALAFKRGKG